MRNLRLILAVLLLAALPWGEPWAKDSDESFFSFLNFAKNKRSGENKSSSVATEAKPEDPHRKMLREADAGNLDAQLSLGYIFLYGEGDIKPDYNKAFHYYEMAAAQNDNVAINNLGSLYYSGIGTPANVAKAMEMFDKAAKLGNVEAAVNLAFLYMTDNPLSKDSKRAMELFQTAANANNPTAQFMLGYAHLYGYLVPRDYARAFELLQKSAMSKYDEAQYQTALLYMEGKGVPQNYGKAVNFLNAARLQGNLEAMMTLGTILAEGRKYKRDVYTAHILFNLASVRGAEKAAEFRDRLSQEMEIDMILRAQAQADAFREQPSELTTYIHQTFGKNIKAYIDRNLPKKQPEPVKEKTKPKKEERTGLL